MLDFGEISFFADCGFEGIEDIYFFCWSLRESTLVKAETFMLAFYYEKRSKVDGALCGDFLGEVNALSLLLTI